MDQFHFHPRCTPMKLTHLSFADDLILCTKGDHASVHLMLKAFKLFSKSSSLKTNVQKSFFYCCGIEESEVTRIHQVSGIRRGTPAFKYLGVPIYFKIISIAQCDCLVEKMTVKVRV